MVKPLGWITRWAAYRRCPSGRLVVACTWCQAVVTSEGFVVERRTGLAVLPVGWDRMEGKPLCPLCVSLYCTDRS
ncbi:hypothetical protein SUDANB140_02545 [Streptomyces sp. enrichment culture]